MSRYFHRERVPVDSDATILPNVQPPSVPYGRVSDLGSLGAAVRGIRSADGRNLGSRYTIDGTARGPDGRQRVRGHLSFSDMQARGPLATRTDSLSGRIGRGGMGEIGFRGAGSPIVHNAANLLGLLGVVAGALFLASRVK